MEPVLPVLDNTISFPYAERTVLDTVGLLLSVLEQRSGVKVGLGTVPGSAMAATHVSLGAINEPARDVLLRALHATAPNISWRLLYAPFPINAYYLNIRFVLQKS
jgi:hypothetical protein